MIAQAREAIGLGLTLEEFGARYFSQGSMSKVVLKIDRSLSEEQARSIVANYERFHKGAGNWHRPAVAPAGTDVQQITIPPDDAQFLESREFQALDVARWFRVPPHRVGIVSGSTSWGSGLAEENTALTQMTFRPWIQRLESAFTYYTAGPEDMGILIKFDDSVLMKGSFEDTIKTWTEAVLGGWVRPNEARTAIGLEPIPEGDSLLIPLAPSGPAVKDPPPGQVITNGAKPTTQHDPQGQDNTNHSSASSTAPAKTGGGPNGKTN
jgi:HK97 family phage portal protein